MATHMKSMKLFRGLVFEEIKNDTEASGYQLSIGFRAYNNTIALGLEASKHILNVGLNASEHILSRAQKLPYQMLNFYRVRSRRQLFVKKSTVHWLMLLNTLKRAWKNCTH